MATALLKDKSSMKISPRWYLRMVQVRSFISFYIQHHLSPSFAARKKNLAVYVIGVWPKTIS